MKLSTLARAAVLAASLRAATAHGEPPHMLPFMGPPPMSDMMGGEGPGFMLPLMLKRVDLTDDQRGQIRKIMDADHQALRALFKQLQAANEDVANRLFAPGKLQQVDLAPQVQRVVQLRQQLMEQGLKTTLAIRAVLTPEQLTKAAQLKDRMQKLRAEMRSLLEEDPAPRRNEERRSYLAFFRAYL